MRWINKTVLSYSEMEADDSGPITDVSSGEDKRFTIDGIANYIVNRFSTALGNVTRTIKAAIDSAFAELQAHDTRISNNRSDINTNTNSIVEINGSIAEINDTLDSGDLTKYKAGDTVVLNANISCVGFTRTNTFAFLIPMPKSPLGLTASIDFDSENAITLYGVNGMIGGSALQPSRFSIVSLYTKFNGVAMSLSTTTPFTNVVDKSPITAQIRGTITFS